jgi:hypothetical protein
LIGSNERVSSGWILCFQFPIFLNSQRVMMGRH